MLGRWLLQAQDGAELQDVCEAVLADRAQGRTRSHFALPLRREPEDTSKSVLVKMGVNRCVCRERG